MIKSWFDWLSGKRGDIPERRAVMRAPAIPIQPSDIDPRTGALRWERFMVMFNAEQEREPGVLLVVDLSARSNSLDMGSVEQEGDILPWLAQAIRQAVRGDDLLAHVYEYRFVVLLRGAPAHVGQMVCQRILDSVDNTIFMTASGTAKLKVKIGGRAFQPASDRDILEEALLNLDDAQRSGQTSVLH